MYSQYLGFMYCGILLVLADSQYFKILYCEYCHTAILAVFWGSILWNTAILEVFGGSILWNN